MTETTTTTATGVASGAAARLRFDWFIKASPEKVFRAWTDPAELGWFFNDTMPRPDEPIEVDLRPGGVWRQVMVIDADKRYVTGGIYREIVPGNRLVFAWGAVGGWPDIALDRLDDSPEVTVLFEPRDGGTALTVDVVLPASLTEQAAREGWARALESGWRLTVDRLAAAFRTH